MLKTIVLLNIFLETMTVSIEIFYNIINVFTVTLDQFNASMLNKSINLFYIHTDPKLLN